MTITRTTRWVALAAYVPALTAVSLLPSGSKTLGGWDTAISPSLQNTLHVPAYAGLLLAAVWAWPAAGRGGLRVSIVGLACIAFGGLMECLQAAVPGRTGSLSDTLLNAAGAFLGSLFVLSRNRLRRGPRRSSGSRSPAETSKEYQVP